MRIVTWNVNGIRRVHKDLLRQGKKSWLECLESLEGDIICIQELKCERATMDPIYVNVVGWRSYFSFPVDKKAYSGVAIYVREAYMPSTVETAICGPAYDRYFEQDNAEFIGGYPRQISTVEARQVDREGRAVVLDFGGFVMIGTYCPAGAESDDRIAYRQLWWRALEERCLNLIRDGRQIILTGDLNVNCEVIDHVEGDPEDYKTENLGPVGKTFHRLLNGDDGEQQDAALVDLTRHFHPERTGMFTCWSVKLSARQGNYGSRIDFVLASPGLLPYFTSSNVRPDIHGSDHCPVDAHMDEEQVEPPLLIHSGAGVERGSSSNFTSSQRTLSTEYFKRQSNASPQRASTIVPPSEEHAIKRKADSPVKGVKKAQKTIASFFRSTSSSNDLSLANQPSIEVFQPSSENTILDAGDWEDAAASTFGHPMEGKRTEVINAYASLFTRPEVPVCTGHGKPAKLQKTKKKGINQGREFWMCAMPLGDGQCKYWKWRKG